MKFNISRDVLLKLLNLVIGVIERRQTLPILSNVLMTLENNQLSLTATDLEIELVSHTDLQVAGGGDGKFTIPARKVVDICKSLSDSIDIEFIVDADKVEIKAGRSRFTLSTLPVSDFPSMEEGGVDELSFELPSGTVKRLIEQTSFAMAQDDVRYYLNGALLEMKTGRLRMVATDGHRLAVCAAPDLVNAADASVIIPRKGILELARLLDSNDDIIHLQIGNNRIRIANERFTFTSKLIDGKYPQYENVFPTSPDKIITGNRLELKRAFIRAAILSNETYRSVCLKANDNILNFVAKNAEQEQAEENVVVKYQGSELEFGFNVDYLVDILSVLEGDEVQLAMTDTVHGVLVEEVEKADSQYVVMPIKL